MGQPRQWEPYVVPAAAWGTSDAWRGSLTAGAYRHVTHPLLGLFGFASEVFATVDPGVQPGARLLATSRALGLSGGAEWDGRTHSVSTMFSFETAIRRGGLLGHGTMVRLDWRPGRDDARGLMSDGEASLVVSGLHAANGVVDLYYIMARSTWIDTKAELDALVPRPKGILARIANLIRFTL